MFLRVLTTTVQCGFVGYVYTAVHTKMLNSGI